MWQWYKWQPLFTHTLRDENNLRPKSFLRMVSSRDITRLRAAAAIQAACHVLTERLLSQYGTIILIVSIPAQIQHCLRAGSRVGESLVAVQRTVGMFSTKIPHMYSTCLTRREEVRRMEVKREEVRREEERRGEERRGEVRREEVRRTEVRRVEVRREEVRREGT